MCSTGVLIGNWPDAVSVRELRREPQLRAGGAVLRSVVIDDWGSQHALRGIVPQGRQQYHLSPSVGVATSRHPSVLFSSARLPTPPLPVP